MFSAYDVGAWKPDPALFLAAASAMKVPPERCVVIEDSDVGLAAARAAGMRCLKFEPHHGKAAGDVPVFRHYSELGVALERLLAGLTRAP